jgi:hypothetical protein
VTAEMSSSMLEKGRRPYRRMSPALAAKIVRLRGEKKSYREIAEITKVSEGSVANVLTQPATRAEAMDLVKRNGLDRKSVRERQKDLVIERLAKTTHAACDLVDETLADSNAKDFAFAMQGLERLDKVSGNTVGEGQRVIHEGLQQPQDPRAELKELIRLIVWQPDETPDPRDAPAALECQRREGRTVR